MTKEIGLNSTVRVGNKKLHLQTCYVLESKKILSSIFQDGRLVNKRVMNAADGDISETMLEKEVKQFHAMIISDLELLFYVADKVALTHNIAFIERLGWIFFEKGFYDESIAQCQNIIKLDPGNITARVYISKALFSKGDFAAALENLQTVISADPENPSNHLLLGQIMQKRNEYQKSIQAIEKALALDNANSAAHCRMGLVLLESIGDVSKDVDPQAVEDTISKASRHFKQAIKLSHGYNAHMIQSAVEKAKDRQQIGMAIAEIESACEEPEMPGTSILNENEFYLKFMFSGSDKDNKELGHYITTLERATMLHPTDADVRQNLGIAYLIRGWQYFAKAIEEFRAVVSRDVVVNKAKQRLKLLENEGRGFLILLRAILK